MNDKNRFRFEARFTDGQVLFIDGDFHEFSGDKQEIIIYTPDNDVLCVFDIDTLERLSYRLLASSDSYHTVYKKPKYKLTKFEVGGYITTPSIEINNEKVSILSFKWSYGCRKFEPQDDYIDLYCIIDGEVKRLNINMKTFIAEEVDEEC